MPENGYTLKFVIGSISVEVAGPKEFVQPIYGIVKPLLEKEIQDLVTKQKREDQQTGAGDFEKKASLPEFYKEKKPASDIQAAALIAFFYLELAEPEERKSHIDTELLIKGMKQCHHPIPEKPDQTLRNAKNYGYLDSTGEAGEFKLTTTGYNLVAHTLPFSEKGTGPKIKHKKTKKTAKKGRKTKRSRDK